MPSFLTGRLRYPDGDLVLYSAQPWHGPPRPVVVLIHGALRWSDLLTHWAEALADIADVVLVDLPGHGWSDAVMPATLDALATRVMDGVKAGLAGRDVLLVGESLGGLVALAMGGMSDLGPVRAVLAADPPFVTRKLVNVHANFRIKMREVPENKFYKSLAFEILGITDKLTEDRIYYPVLDALKVPATIVTGDEEQFPIRQRTGVACLMDGADRFVLERFYGEKVKVHQLKDSGHLLLADRVEACLALMKPLLAEVASRREAAPIA